MQRRILYDVLLFLLSAQYVQSKLLPDQLFQTVVGSGMGLIHSPDVTNYALYMQAEKDFLCTYNVREKYGLIDAIRYFDDLLIIFKERDDCIITNFVRDFKRVCGPFSFKIEEQGKAVNMLNVHIFPNNNRLCTKAIFKDTSLAVPLSVHSAHPAKVHRTWPKSTLRKPDVSLRKNRRFQGVCR